MVLQPCSQRGRAAPLWGPSPPCFPESIGSRNACVPLCLCACLPRTSGVPCSLSHRCSVAWGRGKGRVRDGCVPSQQQQEEGFTWDKVRGPVCSCTAPVQCLPVAGVAAVPALSGQGVAVVQWLGCGPLTLLWVEPMLKVRPHPAGTPLCRVVSSEC